MKGIVSFTGKNRDFKKYLRNMRWLLLHVNQRGYCDERLFG